MLRPWMKKICNRFKINVFDRFDLHSKYETLRWIENSLTRDAVAIFSQPIRITETLLDITSDKLSFRNSR